MLLLLECSLQGRFTEHSQLRKAAALSALREQLLALPLSSQTIETQHRLLSVLWNLYQHPLTSKTPQQPETLPGMHPSHQHGPSSTSPSAALCIHLPAASAQLHDTQPCWQIVSSLQRKHIFRADGLALQRWRKMLSQHCPPGVMSQMLSGLALTFPVGATAWATFLKSPQPKPP